MKNIYDKINDEKFDFDSYEIKQLSEVEKENMKLQFKNKKIVSKRKKFISIAAAFLLVAGLSYTDMGQLVYAKATDVIDEFSYSLKSAMDIKDDIAKYTSVVNTVSESKDIPVKLYEASIVDKKHIYLSTGMKLPEEYNFASIDTTIFINGKKNKVMASSGHSSYDKETGLTNDYTELQLLNEIDLNEDLNIKIKIPSIHISSDSGQKSKDVFGKWEFNFTASGKDLMLDTKHFALNEKIKVEDDEITLEELAINKVSQCIYAKRTTNQKKNDIMYEITGTDDMGRKIFFYDKESDKDTILFKSDKLDIKEDAKVLHLTVKAMKYPEESGRLDTNDMKEVASFDINLK